MAKVFVHIGMIKAGSTTLQENIFEHHSQIDNIWKPRVDGHRILRKIMNLEDHEIPEDEINGYLSNCYKEAEKNNKIAMASCEQIVVFPLISPAARRIKQFFPEAKILFCVREQQSIIRSYYLYQNRRLAGLFGVPKRYDDYPITFEEYMASNFPVDCDEENQKSQRFFQFAWRLKYAKTIEIYENLYGRDNIMVLPIEMSEKDPEEFAKRLGNFLEVDNKEIEDLLKKSERKNASPPKEDLLYERWRRILPTNIHFSKIIPFGAQIRSLVKSYGKKYAAPTVVWTVAYQDQIEKMYSEQNTLLAERYDLDLGRYGYVLPQGQKTAKAA